MSFILLGILNSQAEAAAIDSDFDLLESSILSSAASSVTFDNLDTVAADYKHLQIRVNAATDRSANQDGLAIRFNGNSSNIYFLHRLEGNGSSAAAVANLYLNYMQIGLTTAASVSSEHSGATISDILDFADSSKNTTVRSFTGVSSTFTRVRLFSGHWANTSAVTSIEVFSNNFTNFIAGSRISLYGLKAGA